MAAPRVLAIGELPFKAAADLSVKELVRASSTGRITTFHSISLQGQ